MKRRVFSIGLFFIFVLLFSGSPLVVSQDSVLPTLPPTEIARSDSSKRCPAEFQQIGKECLKVVRVASQASCPAGSELTPETSCAQYSGKTTTCPAEFEMIGGRCERRSTATPSQECREGYILVDNGMCAFTFTIPPAVRCLGDSVPMGDSCILRTEQEPEFACPPGSTSEGKICRIEELYNCTPVRTDQSSSLQSSEALLSIPGTTRTSAALTAPTSSPLAAPTVRAGYPGHDKRLRQTGVETMQNLASAESFRSQVALGMNFMAPQRPQETLWRRAQAFNMQPPVDSKEFVPEKINYVVQATCKRIRTIAAQKICTTGVLSGKMCVVEVEVPPGTLDIGYVIDTIYVPPEIRCPPNFALESPTVCSLVESANSLFVCPGGTQDQGSRCASFTSPQRICPPTFVLESELACVATLRAAPITEFTVRFACVGKECETQPGV